MFRATSRFPAEGIDLRVRVRLERQALLRREFGTDLTFFIPEQVLRSTVGDARVMNDQLLHLALITARPWCTVRVIPASFSLGFLGGPFELLEYANHDPVVYVENQTHSLFPRRAPGHPRISIDPAEVEGRYLDEGQSRELLARVANEYDVPEERHGVAEE